MLLYFYRRRVFEPHPGRFSLEPSTVLKCVIYRQHSAPPQDLPRLVPKVRFTQPNTPPPDTAPSGTSSFPYSTAPLFPCLPPGSGPGQCFWTIQSAPSQWCSPSPWVHVLQGFISFFPLRSVTHSSVSFSLWFDSRLHCLLPLRGGLHSVAGDEGYVTAFSICAVTNPISFRSICGQFCQLQLSWQEAQTKWPMLRCARASELF